jgi:uncharacterized protein YbjT (DUF2867 family)
MKIVVTTPAGHVGSRVVRLLIQAGVRPTLLARRPARLDAAISERADVVHADLADGATVVRVTRDTDALFWVNPSTADPDADPVAWYAPAGRERGTGGGREPDGPHRLPEQRRGRETLRSR